MFRLSSTMSSLTVTEFCSPIGDMHMNGSPVSHVSDTLEPKVSEPSSLLRLYLSPPLAAVQSADAFVDSISPLVSEI